MSILPAPDTAESHDMHKIRRWIILAMLSTLGGFLCAALFAHDYFNTQFLRIGWQRSVMMLIAEAVALVWFTRFLIIHGILGQPLRVKKVDQRKVKKTWTWLMATMLASALLDGGVSVYKAVSSAQRYEDADRITGTLVQVETHSDKFTKDRGMASFDIVAEYDFDGRTYALQTRLSDDPQRRAYREESGKKTMWDYQPGLLEALKQQNPPIPVNMRVNPDNAHEAWIEWGPVGNPPLDFPVLSIAFAFFQLMSTIGISAFLVREYRFGRRDVVPWWLQPASFLALAIEGHVLYLFAVG
jgi:hypothetical protein